MSNSLKLTITDAGRQALVNAENTGTLPLTFTHIAIGSGLYEPSETQTALQNPIKTLTTFGGDIVAADTLHVTILDESQDTYSLGEFGLITDDGVLFAVYASDDAPILEKNASGMMVLSVDAIVTSVDVDSLAFGGTDFMLPPSTEQVAGILRLADNATALAGEDHTRAMTPARTKAVIDQHKSESSAHHWSSITNKPNTATRWPTFAEVTEKPATFPPSSHTHPWSEVTGKPSSYPPSAHGHTWTEINNKPAQATRWPTWNEVTSKPSTFAPSAHEHPWDEITGRPATATRWPSWGEVTGKPTSFTPSSHTHPWSEVTGKPAQATRWPSWSEVTSKPSTFPPSSHSHHWDSITGKPTTFPPSSHNHDNRYVRRDTSTVFNVGRGDVYVESNADDNQNGAGITLRSSSNPNSGNPGSSGAIFAIRSSGQALRFWVGQSVTSTGDNDFHTKAVTATSYSGNGSGITNLNASNLSSGTVPNARLPTTATRWPSWSEVTGKPSSFTPSSHSHPWSEVTGKPAQATRWPSWSEVSSKPSTFPPATSGANDAIIANLNSGFYWHWSGNRPSDAPGSAGQGAFIKAGGSSGAIILHGATSDSPEFHLGRVVNDGDPVEDWVRLIHDGNLTSNQTVTLASSGPVSFSFTPACRVTAIKVSNKTGHLVNVSFVFALSGLVGSAITNRGTISSPFRPGRDVVLPSHLVNNPSNSAQGPYIRIKSNGQIDVLPGSSGSGLYHASVTYYSMLGT